jgi:hypothetical protein
MLLDQHASAVLDDEGAELLENIAKLYAERDKTS